MKGRTLPCDSDYGLIAYRLAFLKTQRLQVRAFASNAHDSSIRNFLLLLLVRRCEGGFFDYFATR